MQIALISATPFEIQPLLDFLQKNYPTATPDRYELPNLTLHVWVTGVGLMATTYQITRRLAQTPVQWVLNAGIAGSFRRDWELGTVVQVVADQLGDCGVEDADGKFSSIFDMGLTDRNEPPFVNGKLYNPTETTPFLPEAQAITVHQVNGNAASIQKMQEKYQADIETMEGAAVHYVCQLHHVPFLQIRSLSNYVEPRNKANWQIGLAIENLNKVLLDILSSL